MAREARPPEPERHSADAARLIAPVFAEKRADAAAARDAGDSGFHRRGALRLRLHGRAGGSAQFGLEPRDGGIERLAFAAQIGFRHRRLEALKLPQQGLARPLIDRPACFGRRIRQASDGLGQQGVIISHALQTTLDLGQNRGTERAIAAPPGVFHSANSNDPEKDYEPELCLPALDSWREAPPAPRSIPRSGAHI